LLIILLWQVGAVVAVTMLLAIQAAVVVLAVCVQQLRELVALEV
jgi:hypothetical protein